MTKNTNLSLFEYGSFITTLILSTVFLFSGTQKIFLPYDFLSILYGYEIVGPAIGFAIAMLLPWFELSIGLCLLTRQLKIPALLLSIILFICFVSVRFSVLLRGLVIPCGCYGLSEDVVNWQNTGMTVLLLVITVIEFSKVLLEQKNNKLPTLSLH